MKGLRGKQKKEQKIYFCSLLLLILSLVLGLIQMGELCSKIYRSATHSQGGHSYSRVKVDGFILFFYFESSLSYTGEGLGGIHFYSQIAASIQGAHSTATD